MLREKPVAQIAKDLGIAESGLRRWMVQADVDEGKREGLSSDERKELVELRRAKRCSRWRWRSSSGRASTSRGRTFSQNDLPGGPRARRRRGCPSRRSAGCWRCRPRVSTTGIPAPASGRAWHQAHLMHAIRDAHAASYGTYGPRRVHAELVLGQHIEVSHGRVERLMRTAGLQGVHRICSQHSASSGAEKGGERCRDLHQQPAEVCRVGLRKSCGRLLGYLRRTSTPRPKHRGSTSTSRAFGDVTDAEVRQFIQALRRVR